MLTQKYHIQKNELKNKFWHKEQDLYDYSEAHSFDEFMEHIEIIGRFYDCSNLRTRTREYLAYLRREARFDRLNG